MWQQLRTLLPFDASNQCAESIDSFMADFDHTNDVIGGSLGNVIDLVQLELLTTSARNRVR